MRPKEITTHSGETSAPASSVAGSMPVSRIREIMELAWKDPEAIHLEVGEPDFPTPEHVVETAHRGGAGIGTDGGEAQKGGESAHCGQKEQEGAFELAADKEADADEHDSEPGYGKPHAVQHRHKIAIHR